jgi:uncharacterized protein YceK
MKLFILSLFMFLILAGCATTGGNSYSSTSMEPKYSPASNNQPMENASKMISY